MTEREYIDTANLVKLRQAYSLLCCAYFPEGARERNAIRAAGKRIMTIIERLAKAVEKHRDAGGDAE